MDCSNTSSRRCWTSCPTPPPGAVRTVPTPSPGAVRQLHRLLCGRARARCRPGHAACAPFYHFIGTKAGNLLETLPPVGFARFPERFSGTLARRCVSNSPTPCSNTYSEPSVGLFQHLVWAKCLTPPHSRRRSNVGPRGLIHLLAGPRSIDTMLGPWASARRLSVLEHVPASGLRQRTPQV